MKNIYSDGVKIYFIFCFQKKKKCLASSRVHTNTGNHIGNVNSDEMRGRGTFLKRFFFFFFAIPANPAGTSRLPNDGVHRTLVADTVRDSDNLFARVRLRRYRDVRTQYYI